MTSRKRQVLVLGAGISGLSSALRILESCNNVQVTVMAEKFSPHTTSSSIPGFWHPYKLGETDIALIHSLGGETYRHLRRLALSSLAASTGVQQTSGYLVTHEKMEEDLVFHDIVDGYRRITEEELARFPMAKDGVFYTSLTTDVTKYLKWLTDRLTSNGCRFVQKKIHSLKELSGGWDIVVNCLGLGARTVLGDDNIFPTRGHLIKVQAPWINHFLMAFTPSGLTHILPNEDFVAIGTVSQKNDWRLECDDKDSTDIWTRVINLVPSMKSSKVLKHWVGLRPTRTALRLEAETMVIEEGRPKLLVVHNYGHGGAGITLHWGCSGRVADMVSTFLQSLDAEDALIQKRSKL